MSDEKRTRVYKIVDHMNAVVNLLRSQGWLDLADTAKEIIREANRRHTV